MYEYGEIVKIDDEEYVVGQVSKYKGDTYLLLVEPEKYSKFIYVRLAGNEQIEVIEDPDIILELTKLLKEELPAIIDEIMPETSENK